MKKCGGLTLAKRPVNVGHVRVGHNRENPVHDAYFQVGFLNDDGSPGGYSEVWCNTYDRSYELSEMHYLYPVRLLHTETDM